ncbi:MAG: cupredoxin domain-containing protein [Acidimicrobiia bacterium]
MMKRYKLVALLASVPLAATFVATTAVHSGAEDRPFVQRIVVPEADQFTPFAATVRVGDVVRWVNRDTDDHTLVSDDAFNTAGHRGLNVLLVGTDNNGGKPGTIELRFRHPGTFVYYCRFHSHLDPNNQPVAPGPDGGIQDAKGNFGTPMMGVITVRG